MHRQQGFTLIELLVVIAIIGILATLVITQLGGATTKARNANAQSDVVEAGKAIQVFSNDDAAGGSVISTNGATSQITLTVPAAMTYFSGTQSFTTGSLSYGTAITKTPSAGKYTYAYIAATGTSGALSAANPSYTFCTNTVAVGTTPASFFATTQAGNTVPATCP